MAEITRCDGVLFKRSLFGSYTWLKENRDKINELNVFPVPDGDTGTNMLLTLEAACEEIEEKDNSDLSDVAGKVAHGALMGARGNSGVILSQILRGFSQGVGDRASVDSRELAQAFDEATKVAYKGVTKPTEGTILTVARAVSASALAKAEETQDIAELIQTVVQAAQRAVDDTPSQLAVLREAGVVDAGGYGLMVILEGFLRTVRGTAAIGTREAPKVETTPALAAAKVGAHAIDTPEEGWGFCTEFLIEEPKVPFDTLREELMPMGNSAVIVGDDSLVRVHIHTLDPGALIAHAAGTYGQLQKLKVEDMTRQHHQILADGERGSDEEAAPVDVESNGHGVSVNGHIGVVAVTVGDGFRRIFEGLGAGVVEGGQTMNPSTEDLVQAVEAATAEEVIILPNNKNVIMTAQQVSELCDKPIRVVPTRTVPQGISALLNLDPDGGLEANAEAMAAALKGVQTIEVTRAVRTTSLNGIKIKSGDVIALVNGKLKGAGQDPVAVIDGALDSLKPDGFELLTIYGGAEVSDSEIGGVAEHLRDRLPNLTVETQRGEQDHYPYILSLE